MWKVRNWIPTSSWHSRRHACYLTLLPTRTYTHTRARARSQTPKTGTFVLDFDPNGDTKDFPKSMTATLLSHEAVPGHHMQVCACVCVRECVPTCVKDRVPPCGAR